MATGTNYPDALSAGAAAGSFDGMVVVLTNGTSMPASTDAYLEAKANSGQLRYVAAIGGSANMALKGAGWSGYDALVGADRYQTSYLVAHEIFGAFGSVGVATGVNWPDSLSGGALMGNRQGPLLLVNPATGLTPAEDAPDRRQPRRRELGLRLRRPQRAPAARRPAAGGGHRDRGRHRYGPRPPGGRAPGDAERGEEAETD